MKIEEVKIISNDQIAGSTYSLKFKSVPFSKETRPGQFFNVKVSDDSSFILRRPFSIAQIESDTLELIYNVVGVGTNCLSNKTADDTLSILGPLGNGFSADYNFDTAIILGGGIGVAPFPFLYKKIIEAEKKCEVFFGFRSVNDMIPILIDNIHYSSDDGSFGFKGNVIESFNNFYKNEKSSKLKIFACGPNPMLKAIIKFAEEKDIEAEVSIESYMACGFGICQGCPVEAKDQKDKYYLVCKDGPCFNVKDINL
jgi:dihydroorotate dehydrogenase electron transfer subunit